MEKLSNLDSRMSDSITRIHARITKNETDIDTVKLAVSSTCDIVRPMAEKGARIHTGMVVVAKGLAVAVGTMLLSMFVWLIQQGAHK